jgi:hypothetical protein
MIGILLQLSLHPVAVVGRLEQSRTDTTRNEKEYKNTEYTKQKTKIKTKKHKKNIKNIRRVIKK